MDFNWNVISKVTAALFIVIGLAMVPSLIVAAIYDERNIISAFLVTIIPSVSIGIFLLVIRKPAVKRTKMRDGYLIVSLCWIIASLISAVPFVVSGEIPNPVNAFFETCSGYSTTGSSILTDIEVMSKGLLFWRSFTHWLGGMGILIFAIALLPSLGISGQAIAKAEAPGPTLDRLTPKLSDTAKMLYIMYFAFTVVQTILLLLGGMSLFDALIHTFGTVGTGGFSNYNTSVAHFDSLYIDMVISVFMILSGVNFNLYFVLLRHGLSNFFKDSELKLYFFIIGAITFLVASNLVFLNVYENIWLALRYSLFQVASIISTTGFATANYDLWPTFAKICILLIMFIGGCSSSTGGGIKVIRILVMLKLIRRGIALRLHPNAVVQIKLGGRILNIDTVTTIASFIFTYMMTIFISTILISLNGFNMLTSFSAVVTCLGNIGPGFDLVGPVMNFDLFSDGSTFLLAMLMLAGRLELFTIFMLLTPRFWNPSK